ncbi:MAG: TetR/AcrR family transcriptional regulator [Acidimicrobiia bacterium]
MTPRTDSGVATRQRIIDAAMKTVIARGYAGASARTIAKAGDFNQALIFYHFGSVNSLMLAALDAAAGDAMKRYRDALEKTAETSDATELIERAIALYREDLDSGHITLLTELVGAGLSHPDLADGLIKRMEPWIGFAEEAIVRVIKDSFLEPILSAVSLRTAATAVVAMYLGVDVFLRLDSSGKMSKDLFKAAETLKPFVGGALGAGR